MKYWRTLSTFFVISIYAFLYVGQYLYAQDDNLDMYFEDYFMDDVEENEGQGIAIGVQEVTNDIKANHVQSPVSMTHDTDSAIDFRGSYLDGIEHTDDVLQSVSDDMSDEDGVSVADRQDRMPVESQTYIDIDGTGSYVDLVSREIWNFQDAIQHVEYLERNRLLERTADLLIGQEDRRVILEIRADEELKKITQFKTLKACVTEATREHLPIDIARDKVIWYRRRIRKAERDMWPQLSGVTSRSHKRQGGAPDSHAQIDDVKFVMKQSLYAGGTLWNKVQEEKANLKTAIAEYNKIFADLALEVATGYFNLAKERTMLAYRKNLFTKAAEVLGLSEEKYNAHLISEIEHLNVQSQHSQINHNLQKAKEGIDLAVLELQKSMNMDFDTSIDVYRLDDYFELMGAGLDLEEEQKADSPEAEDGETKKIDELVQMAYENRPEFVIGQNKVDAKKYAEKAQNGNWLPHLSLFMEAGRNREVLEVQRDPKDGRWETEYHLGIECNWNFFGNTVRYLYDNDQGAPSPTGYQSGGKGNWAVTNTVAVGILDNLDQFSTAKEAEIARKEAVLEFELSEKDMVSEVKESYYNYNRAKIQMRSILKKITYREKLVALAKHRSEINEIQGSEYLQAEIDLVEERNTLYQAMIDYFIAKASLNKAIGISNFMDIEQLPSDVVS